MKPTTLISLASLGIPSSNVTVDLKIMQSFDSTTGLVPIPGALLTFPAIPGNTFFDGDFYAFYIENSRTRERVMFDVGLRKDTVNLAPSVAPLFGGLAIPDDIPSQLVAKNFSLQSFSSVIWSHLHPDHIGDMSLWPSTTSLFVGEETNTNTFPSSPDAVLKESDLSGRNVTKLQFSTSTFTIGGKKAIDFFKDGSLYLIDWPGHCPGHLVGLARVTPTTFVLLAGDTFHNGAEIRPSPNLKKHFPIPSDILKDSRKKIARQYFWAPDDNGDLSTRTTPFLTIGNGPPSVIFDPPLSRVRQFDVGVYDSHPDVLVLSSHDPGMRDILTFFPESINGWKKKGWKNRGVWAFADSTKPGYVLATKP